MIQLLTLCLATLVLLVFAAGVVPYALYAASAILAVGALVTAIRQRKQHGRPRKILVALAVVSVAWTLITAIPLADTTLGIDPAAAVTQADDPAPGLSRRQIQTEARQTLVQAEALKLIETADPRFSISLNRAGTLRIVILMIGAWAAAFLAASMSAQHKFWFLRFLIASGIVLAGGGVICRYIMPCTQTVWWFLPVTASNSMGAFINANHFGAFLAMLVPAVLAQGVQDIRAREWERLAMWIAALIVITGGVVVSESRGAYLCLAAALAATGLLFLSRRRKRTSMALAGCVVVAILLLTALSTPDMERELDTLNRYLNEAPPRVQLWQSSLAIWRDFPIIGTGAQGFRTVSTFYNRSSTTHYFHHAENTYIQILCDYGLVGAIWTLTLLGVIGGYLFHKIRQRRFSMTLMISAAGACMVVLIHGLYDFGIHVPLYGIIAATYFGMLLGRPASAHRKRQISPELPNRPWYDRWLVPGCALAACGVVAAVAYLAGAEIYLRDKQWFVSDPDAYIRELPAHAAYVRTPPPPLPALSDDSAADSTVAVQAPLPFREPLDVVADNFAWTPAFWANWFYLAQHTAVGWDLRNYQLAERALTRAAQLNPGNANLWLQLYQLRDRLGQTDAAGAAYSRYLQTLQENRQ